MRTGRRCVGYDTDPAYIEIARQRMADEQVKHSQRRREDARSASVAAPSPSTNEDFRSRATEEGKAAQALAADVLEGAGFEICERNYKIPGLGLLVNLVATDANREKWYFDVTGAFTATRGGLLRTDTLWKSLGRASVLATQKVRPLVLLSSHLPPRRTTGDRALHAIGTGGVHDVMEMLSHADRVRLATYATGGYRTHPLPGFWTEAELDQH